MKAKVIGLNLLFLVPNQVGGTEYHARSFIKALQKHDDRNKYVLFCNQENYHTFILENKNWKKVYCPVPARYRWLRILYEQLILPFQLLLHQCSLVHSMGYFGPIFTPRIEQVVTIHDANWKDHPEDFSKIELQILKILIGLNMKTASKVIVVSKYAKERLEKFFPLLSKKIVVITNALSEKFLGMLKTKTTNRMKGPYALTVSAFYPHKKIQYLLQVWKEIERLGKRISLVLIGQNGQDERQISQLVSQLKTIKWKRKVSLKELAAYYQHARLFVHPSIYEGYGFPVYEALAAGLPVIAGNKQPYQSQIQAHLVELSFDLKKDVELILNTFKKNKKSPVIGNGYKQEVKKLIGLYNNL